MIQRLLLSIFVYHWLILPYVGALLLGLAELGFRFGRRQFVLKDDARKTQITGIQGPMLGILALLLGFTFAMAMNRYDARRELVGQEANSIKTTYLRASFLPAADQAAVENLLRQYVDARLAFYAAGTDADQIATAEAESARLQRQLWSYATAAATAEKPAPLLLTFVTALNDTINLDSARLQALRIHVPGVVWLMLLLVAGCGCSASGYAAGTTGRRGAFTGIILPLLITVVIFLIADLDSPRRGNIGISQQPLLNLRQTFQPPSS